VYESGTLIVVATKRQEYKQWDLWEIRDSHGSADKDYAEDTFVCTFIRVYMTPHHRRMEDSQEEVGFTSSVHIKERSLKNQNFSTLIQKSQNFLPALFSDRLLDDYRILEQTVQ
jgi:hypothetical protein